MQAHTLVHRTLLRFGRPALDSATCFPPPGAVADRLLDAITQAAERGFVPLAARRKFFTAAASRQPSCAGHPAVWRGPPLAIRLDPVAASLKQQARFRVAVPEKMLTKKVSRSSGAGGQSVNMSDTRVQLSFEMGKADWIPVDVLEKMRKIHKNRITKKGEFTVACQVTSSQLDNYRIAVKMIGDLIEEAEKAVEEDIKEANKLPYQEAVFERMRAQGREKEIEKKQENFKKWKEKRKENKNRKFSFD